MRSHKDAATQPLWAHRRRDRLFDRGDIVCGAGGKACATGTKRALNAAQRPCANRGTRLRQKTASPAAIHPEIPLLILMTRDTGHHPIHRQGCFRRIRRKARMPGDRRKSYTYREERNDLAQHPCSKNRRWYGFDWFVINEIGSGIVDSLAGRCSSSDLFFERKRWKERECAD